MEACRAVDVQVPGGVSLRVSFLPGNEILVKVPPSFRVTIQSEEVYDPPSSSSVRKRKREGSSGSLLKENNKKAKKEQKKNEERRRQEEERGFEILPAEIQQLILLRLTVEQVARCARVSKAWKSATDDDTFWRQLFACHFGRVHPRVLNATQHNFGTPANMTHVPVWKRRCLSCAKAKRMSSDNVNFLPWMIMNGYTGLAESTLKGKEIIAANSKLLNTIANLAVTHNETSLLSLILNMCFGWDLDSWLRQAALLNDVEMVKCLVGLGTSLQKLSSRPRVLLLDVLPYACMYGNLPLVEFCLSQYPYLEKWQQTDPFLMAVRSGNIPIVIALLQRMTIDPNASNYLDQAVEHKNFEVAQLLLNSGFELTRASDSVLTRRVAANDLEGVKWVIERGALANPTQIHPAVKAAVQQHNMQMLATLLDAYFRVDPEGMKTVFTKAFIEAVRAGGFGLAEKILEQGGILVDVNARDDFSLRTPIMFAAEQGNAKMVGLLIRYNAELNHRSRRKGRSALLSAVNMGHKEVARMLLEAGADVNTQSETGNTPLIMAVLRNDTEMVDLLLKCGASLRNVNWQGKNVVEIAQLRGHTELAAYLYDAYFSAEKALDTQSLNQSGKCT